MKKEIEDEIIRLAKQGVYSETEIGQKIGVSNTSVAKIMRAAKILPITSIRKQIIHNPNMSCEEIAQIANIEIESAKKIKNKIFQEQRKVEELKEKTARQKRKKTNVSVSEREMIKQKLKTYPAISAIAEEFNVERNIIEQIYREIQQEEQKKSETERIFKLKKRELIHILHNTKKSNMTRTQATIMTNKANTLVNKFSQYMTQYDYALITYTYIMSREYQKGIDFAEEHLELEKSTLGALEEKIKEIMLNQEKDRKASNTSKKNINQEEQHAER